MAASDEASRPFAGLSDVSISDDIAVEGDISVPVGPSARRDDEFSTLDEPVRETVLRDLRAVGKKFVHVLYPKRSAALLRDWDLWGPLLLCVTLALLLQGGAADSDYQGGPQFAEVPGGPSASHERFCSTDLRPRTDTVSAAALVIDLHSRLITFGDLQTKTIYYFTTCDFAI